MYLCINNPYIIYIVPPRKKIRHTKIFFACPILTHYFTIKIFPIIQAQVKVPS